VRSDDLKPPLPAREGAPLSGARWVKLPSGARFDCASVCFYRFKGATPRPEISVSYPSGGDAWYFDADAAALLAALDAYHFPPEAAPRAGCPTCGGEGIVRNRESASGFSGCRDPFHLTEPTGPKGGERE